MERPGDDYKRTNNMRLETRDKLFGGQVSRLQVAELVAAAVSNPDLAENKVGEPCSLLCEVRQTWWKLPHSVLSGAHRHSHCAQIKAHGRSCWELPGSRWNAPQIWQRTRLSGPCINSCFRATGLELSCAKVLPGSWLNKVLNTPKSASVQGGC